MNSVPWAQENLRATCGHLRDLAVCKLRPKIKYLRSFACSFKYLVQVSSGTKYLYMCLKNPFENRY